MNAPDTNSPTDDLVIPKFTSAEIKQLRKNIERLKAITHVEDLKRKPHFDINQFFSLGKK